MKYCAYMRPGILAVPGNAMELLALELPETSSEGCVIFVQWKSPSNFAVTQINHYNLKINETIDGAQSIGVFTTNEESKVLYLAECVVPSISVRAIDECNREGQSVVVSLKRDTHIINGGDKMSTTTELPAYIKNQSSTDISRSMSF